MWNEYKASYSCTKSVDESSTSGDGSPVVGENRKKKSIFKRAQERLQALFRRQKSHDEKPRLGTAKVNKKVSILKQLSSLGSRDGKSVFDGKH